VPVRSSLKLVVPAAAVALIAAAPSLAATAKHPAHVARPSAALRGSVQPSVAHSALIGKAEPATPVRVSFVLRPEHAGLLRTMAARSSGGTALTQGQIDRLFRPSAEAQARVAAYMRARGFRPLGRGVLTMSFAGTVAQAQHAFGVQLARYRLGDGTAYRAPTGAIHLPPALAPDVISVTGLSTLPLMQPLGLHRAPARLQPHTTVGDCPAADTTQTANPGSLQPDDLAGTNGYDSQTLLNAGSDGTGENVALVEFSDYVDSDQSTYQSCYGTAVTIARHNVDGGNPSSMGGDEVALDQEVLASASPGIGTIHTYVAPSDDTMAAVLDAILRTHAARGIHIVSDSWGICEIEELRSDAAATDTELQLLAVAGVSFYAASGDDGASDCNRFGIKAPEVDDPASQPYATGVGGTSLVTSPTRAETVWGGHGVAAGGGGGGISAIFTMPGWQKGRGVIRTGISSKTKCGGKTRYCREVPDVAFDADPDTGYVIHCTVGQCSTANNGWQVFGGTSAAAPLMAAYTAIANSHSIANGGGRVGFANPFLYHEFADPVMFHDITSGTNSIYAGTTFSARAGYDLATGMGSIDVGAMATALAAYTGGTPLSHTTKVTGAAGRRSITNARGATLSGKLVDTTTHRALGGRSVQVEGFVLNTGAYKLFKLHTGPKGGWSIRLTTKQLRSNFLWHVVYAGEQAHRGISTPFRILGVAPTLKASSKLPFSGGAYHVAHGKLFTVSGTSNPNMHSAFGAPTQIEFQVRVHGAKTWHTTTSVARVGKKGRFSVRGEFTGAGTFDVRFRYRGGPAVAWWSTRSRAIVIKVS
jgi:pro-kumamolisin-like protein/subtilase family protein